MYNSRLVFESAKWQSVTKVHEYKRMGWQTRMKAKQMCFMFMKTEKKGKKKIGMINTQMEFYCRISIIRCKWMHVIFSIFRNVFKKENGNICHVAQKRVNTEHIYNCTFFCECIIWIINGTGIGTHSMNPSNYITYLFVHFCNFFEIPSGNCCILMSKLTFNLFSTSCPFSLHLHPNNGCSKANARQKISNNNERNESIECLIQCKTFPFDESKIN